MANSLISKNCTRCGKMIRSTWADCSKCRDAYCQAWTPANEQKATWVDERRSPRVGSKKILMPCMTCGEKFKSQDKSKHRICDCCKSSSAWRAGENNDYSTGSWRSLQGASA